MRISCVPRRQPHTYELHRKIRVYKMFNILKVLTQLYFTLLYTQLYAHIQDCWMISTMHSCYIMLLLSPIKKIYIRGRWQAHYVPNIAHFKLLFWSDENTFCGKSFNAVSLRAPSTWPPNCAHIILIHSSESPVWYFKTCCCFMSRSYSVGSPNMFDIW